MPTPHEIISDPKWYLHNIDLDKRSLLFLRTTDQQLAEASFLDERFTPDTAQAQVSLDEALSVPALGQPVPRYIFHTAFCCSTLLARCLDFRGSTLALKEPLVLMTLANYQRTRHKLLSNRSDAKRLFQLVSACLFRPFPDQQGNLQTVIVKPTNTVNNLITPLLQVHPDSRALLLHSDLRAFLISLLKKGEEGRSFARGLFNIFQMDSVEAQQLAPAQLMRMTDLQIASLTWHLQLENYQDATKIFNAKQVRSLHCDDLLADAERVLEMVIAHLSAQSLAENYTEVYKNAPLQSNSKTPKQAFTADTRRVEHQRTERQYAESLDMIVPWASSLRFKYPAIANVANAL